MWHFFLSDFLSRFLTIYSIYTLFTLFVPLCRTKIVNFNSARMYAKLSTNQIVKFCEMTFKRVMICTKIQIKFYYDYCSLNLDRVMLLFHSSIQINVGFRQIMVRNIHGFNLYNMKINDKFDRCYSSLNVWYQNTEVRYWYQFNKL